MDPDPARRARELLEEARRLAGNGDYAAAAAACERVIPELKGLRDPLLEAQVALARLEADPEREPDEPELREAAGVLAAHGAWEETATARSLLGRIEFRRKRFPEARAHLLSAIGAAEVSGARVLGPTLIQRLAEVELAAGQPAKAVPMLHIALTQLDKVPLLAARLREAECVERLGDAHAALGDRDRAILCWRDAADRQARLDRRKESERVKGKIG